jgi:hypothetical protein
MAKTRTEADAYHSARPASEGGRVVSVHSGGAKRNVEFADFDATTLRTFIASVLRNGDNCSITYTSDGGACSFTILSNGDRWKCYVTHPDELRLKLDALWDAAYPGAVEH